MKTAGLYIHIPFCLSKCAYCNFVSRPMTFERQEEYIDALCIDLKRQSALCSGKTVDSIYFGGGTPSLLSTVWLDRIFGIINDYYNVSKDCETTVEANPNTVDGIKAAAFRKNGVNRVSIGLQSANGGLLKKIGRTHTFDDFIKAKSILLDSGIDNLSADLMLGLPDQTVEDLCRSIELCLENLKHLSVYCLKTEKGTPLYPFEPDGDLCADMYEAALKCLQKSGFMRYEISNFALKGYKCRHNLKYWACDEYLGLGVAAHGFVDMHRTSYSDDIKKYIDFQQQNAGSTLNLESFHISDSAFSAKKTTPDELCKEYIMLQLRLENGVNLDCLKKRFGYDLAADKSKEIEKLKKHGLIATTDKDIRISEGCFFVSNSIIAEII